VKYTSLNFGVKASIAQFLKSKVQSLNKIQNSKLYTCTFGKTYDKIIYMEFNLEERTAKFGESIILFCQTLKQNSINQPLINQIVRSATSIGANYCEANEASSKSDFYNKAYISKKEANETKHWLRMLSVANPDSKEACRKLWSECQEIVLILAKITSKSTKPR
jgi:four helix bundle protein